MSNKKPDESVPGDVPASENTFFDWMRGLRVPRQPGWIGGVCAGIAARLGIDPIIVRGIVVVLAVLGGPALLLYAAAWLLLPDNYDRIHLQELFRGNFTKAHAGIGDPQKHAFLGIDIDSDEPLVSVLGGIAEQVANSDTKHGGGGVQDDGGQGAELECHRLVRHQMLMIADQCGQKFTQVAPLLSAVIRRLLP